MSWELSLTDLNQRIERRASKRPAQKTFCSAPLSNTRPRNVCPPFPSRNQIFPYCHMSKLMKMCRAGEISRRAAFTRGGSPRIEASSLRAAFNSLHGLAKSSHVSSSFLVCPLNNCSLLLGTNYNAFLMRSSPGASSVYRRFSRDCRDPLLPAGATPAAAEMMSKHFYTL